MIKKLITEISEEDFRKLDLKVFRTERVVLSNDGSHRYDMVEKSLNDILDEEIKYCLDNGYAEDLENLKCPVTIAIHEEPTEKDFKNLRKKFPLMDDIAIASMVRREYSYLDKFMNQYTGMQTFQLGLGIRHLYSTRDYYEAHEDYWKVRKDETKVIYRVRLSEKWIDSFVLKHKTKVVEWPYGDEYKDEGCRKAYLEIYFELIDNQYVEKSRCGKFIYDHRMEIFPVDENGVKIKKE